MSLTAEALVNKSLELVSPPSTYLQLNKLVQDPDSAIDDISAVINTDPALATRLLKIVNSPFYGFPSQINTISRAITIVGTRELMHLVLATSVINAFRGIPASLIDMDDFWHHSFATAITAKLLAEECGHKATERFFIAGLLHNIGSLVLYQSMPELAGEAIRSAEFGMKYNSWPNNALSVSIILKSVMRWHGNGTCPTRCRKWRASTTAHRMPKNSRLMWQLSMSPIFWSRRCHLVTVVTVMCPPSTLQPGICWGLTICRCHCCYNRWVNRLTA